MGQEDGMRDAEMCGEESLDRGIELRECQCKSGGKKGVGEDK